MFIFQNCYIVCFNSIIYIQQNTLFTENAYYWFSGQKNKPYYVLDYYTEVTYITKTGFLGFFTINKKISKICLLCNWVFATPVCARSM